jgi:hypothetical protein
MRESIDTMGTELEERLGFETLLAEISSRFVNVPATEVDREIEDAQRRIYEFLDLEHSSLWQACEGEPGTLPIVPKCNEEGQANRTRALAVRR